MSSFFSVSFWKFAKQKISAGDMDEANRLVVFSRLYLSRESQKSGFQFRKVFEIVESARLLGGVIV